MRLNFLALLDVLCFKKEKPGKRHKQNQKHAANKFYGI